MNWKLSPVETVGVVGVGVGLAWLANKVSNSQKTPAAHTTAMLVGGTVIYTAGVVIGANRPPKGFIEGGGY